MILSEQTVLLDWIVEPDMITATYKRCAAFVLVVRFLEFRKDSIVTLLNQLCSSKNSRHGKKYTLLALLGLTGLLSASGVWAQQTIFNVPSADVTEKQSFFYQHQSELRPWNPGKTWQMTNNLGYGIGKHTELDATFIGLDAFGGKHGWSRNSALGLGFKTSLPLFPKKLEAEELKLVVGELIPIEFTGHSLGSWSYSELSGRIPFTKTRLTAGVNYGTKQIFNTSQFSYMVGYEHPLTKHWMLQGDWFSGKHGQGAFIPGMVYIFKNGTMLSFGYQIPNPHARIHSAFIFELTTFFKQPELPKRHWNQKQDEAHIGVFN